jgi:hypothetical protein
VQIYLSKLCICMSRFEVDTFIVNPIAGSKSGEEVFIVLEHSESGN